MKSLLALASMLFVCSTLPPNPGKPDARLPELNTIKSATLSPAYSCRSKEESRRGYDKTALFVSKASEEESGPDLLFNGACGSKDFFQGSTAGDDMSMIADLGVVPLEEVSSHKAFDGRKENAYDPSRFTWEADVQAGHTYALLINKSRVRGLVVFSVADYIPNKKVDLRYAVREYQLLNVKAEAEGFDWSGKNYAPCPQK